VRAFLTVAEDTFRGYADTAELQAAWPQTSGPGGVASIALAAGTPSSIHPAQYLEITIDNQTGSAQQVVFSRELTFVREASNDSEFFFSFFASADASLAGLMITNENQFWAAPLVFDGAWREYDHRFSFGSDVGPFESTGLTVDLRLEIPAGMSGVLRIGLVRVFHERFINLPAPPPSPDPTAPVLPFPADWDEPPELVIAFNTAVTEAWNGNEQREQLICQPRGRFRYTIVLVDDREAALFNTLMQGGAGSLFSIPLWTERCRLLQAPPGTSLTVVGAGSRLFAKNTGVLFWRSPFYWEAEKVTITPPGWGAGPDFMQIEQAPSLSFTTTDAVLPLRPGILRNPMRLERPATRGMRIPIDVELLAV
jgi:hypothetical protein